jgi:ribosome-associated translation inhibitor RaiA
MRIRVSAPGQVLSSGDIDRIEKDLEKIDRRLQQDRREAAAQLMISNSSNNGAQGYRVTLEVDHGRNHYRAKAEGADFGQAVRSARDDVLRQINDRSRRGHSSHTKH